MALEASDHDQLVALRVEFKNLSQHITEIIAQNQEAGEARNNEHHQLDERVRWLENHYNRAVGIGIGLLLLGVINLAASLAAFLVPGLRIHP